MAAKRSYSVDCDIFTEFSELDNDGLSCDGGVKRRRTATVSHGRNNGANAERERTRVKTLRNAFMELQRTLPTVPADTKLSKLDVLVLATTYIAHLMKTLDEGVMDDCGDKWMPNCFHPMKVSIRLRFIFVIFPFSTTIPFKIFQLHLASDDAHYIIITV